MLKKPRRSHEKATKKAQKSHKHDFFQADGGHGKATEKVTSKNVTSNKSLLISEGPYLERPPFPIFGLQSCGVGHGGATIVHKCFRQLKVCTVSTQEAVMKPQRSHGFWCH